MSTDGMRPTRAAALIDAARDASGVSVRAAAKAAHLSEGRWRQIAKGYQRVTKDVVAPVNAPPTTLAKMAHVVGVSSEQLRVVGAEDVAAELRKLEAAVSDLPTPRAGVGIEVSTMVDFDGLRLEDVSRYWALAQYAADRALREYAKRTEKSLDAARIDLLESATRRLPAMDPGFTPGTPTRNSPTPMAGLEPEGVETMPDPGATPRLPVDQPQPDSDR